VGETGEAEGEGDDPRDPLTADEVEMAEPRRLWDEAIAQRRRARGDRSVSSCNLASAPSGCRCWWWVVVEQRGISGSRGRWPRQLIVSGIKSVNRVGAHRVAGE
jgi:hypothetical protein